MLEHRKRKRLYHKKGQASQKDYKDVIRSCRDEIKKVKAQLELNLATAVKDKNVF